MSIPAKFLMLALSLGISLNAQKETTLVLQPISNLTFPENVSVCMFRIDRTYSKDEIRHPVLAFQGTEDSEAIIKINGSQVRLKSTPKLIDRPLTNEDSRVWSNGVITIKARYRLVSETDAESHYTGQLKLTIRQKTTTYKIIGSCGC